MSEHRIIQGDVLAGLATLADKSIQCIITSIPYYQLRNYGVDGQIGLEPTLQEYLDKIVEVFHEGKRVLRDDGTLFLNVGDSYCGSGRGPPGENGIGNQFERQGFIGKGPSKGGSEFKPKDMMGVPWRVAFALQADGWYLRSDIIWSKPNPMPESVTDRPTKAHEYIFLLTKSPRYFYDAEAIREGVSGGTHACDGLTRNARTVWTITPQARLEAHFATFPDEIPRRCIKAGTSEYGCCPKCGAPYQRIVEASGGVIGKSWHPHADDEVTGQVGFKDDKSYKREFKGWKPGCGCGKLNREPCVVLDPFMGSGTVAVVARELNRSSIGIELNPAYVEIIKKRLDVGSQLDTGVVSYRFEEVIA